MKARSRVVVLQGAAGVLRIEEVALPELRGHQVLLQVHAAGVGYAQLHQVLEPQDEPRLMGTEASCRVTAVGPLVTRVRPGEAVIISPLASAMADWAIDSVSVELEGGRKLLKLLVNNELITHF